MTLADSRLFFRYRYQIIDNIKGNRSSKWKHDMACRLCTSGENETQDHLERCSFTKEMRENLDLTIREDKRVLWRRITRTLKDIYVNNKDIVINDTQNILPNKGNIETGTVDCESTPNLEGQGEALPASDRETCTRGCEGLVTQAVVATSARDMSVGKLIGDHPP